ncbi:hypothetical protein GKZ89_01705 [Bacillus mangrovi]|uniref:Uncharacterized protein n=1 Tax=Metabacillus mangrovi TaxID=1491830 RepID=A0A7X2S1M7_9BACI|nr:hypothetical protein [Metabacillus mangrovi]MTH52104.1 hypothetical protein [Metabacillus mangrovi]
MKAYRCCAACVHFRSAKNSSGAGMIYTCSRLGYETRPEYSFQCWEPKEQVKKLMKKRGEV